MSKINIIIIIISIIILSCNSSKDNIREYLDNYNCQQDCKNDKCFYEFKELLANNFTHLFVFGEFTYIDIIRTAIENDDYIDYDIMMPTNFLVKDGMNKLIFMNNNELVLDLDVHSSIFYRNGDFKIIKAIFDADTLETRVSVYKSDSIWVPCSNARATPSAHAK
ncbi:MAG: hypothetical protein ACPGSD_02835 [Flavobacteriales bacterium]